jgi:hypothetical protein
MRDRYALEPPQVAPFDAATRLAEFLCHVQRQSRLPLSDGFMRENEATKREHLDEVAQTELGAQAPEHDEADHVGWILQAIEHGAAAFAEAALRQRKRR